MSRVSSHGNSDHQVINTVNNPVETHRRCARVPASAPGGLWRCVAVSRLIRLRRRHLEAADRDSAAVAASQRARSAPRQSWRDLECRVQMQWRAGDGVAWPGGGRRLETVAVQGGTAGNGAGWQKRRASDQSCPLTHRATHRSYPQVWRSGRTQRLCAGKSPAQAVRSGSPR